MAGRVKDITGFVAGYLTAIRFHGCMRGKAYWEFQCQCGKIVVKEGSDITKQQKKGIVSSCGCMRRATIGKKSTKHGMCTHPAYAVWRSMNDRCRLPTHQAWRNYGARGITVCERWQERFDNFWEDMGDTYQRGYCLERLDNSKGYSPENCAWRTHRQQSNNTRNTRFVDTPNGRMSASEAADFYGVKRTTFLYRLDHGKTVLEALGLSTTS